jgi:hypothetical protein
MATDATETVDNASPTTESPTSLNAQDFSDSDDEILDNFADGPPPSEPASSTLEADMLNGPPKKERGPDGRFLKKQPGEPPEDTAGEPEPVQDASDEGTVTSPEPTEEPEPPEFSPLLLQMAGLADANAAKEAGFKDPDALLAAVQWRGRLREEGEQPAQPSEQALYRRSPPAPSETPAQQAPPAPETVEQPQGEVPEFQLPAEKMDLLDEDLQDVIRQMTDHFQSLTASQRQDLESLRGELKRRDESVMSQQEQQEEAQFDQVVQELGEDWQEIFGEGTAQDLHRRAQTDPLAGAQLEQRVRLFEATDAIRRVDAEQGYKPADIPQAVPWALQRRYPDKFQQAVSRTPRRGVTASRPTQRNTPPSAKDKLLRDLHKKYPDGGFTKQDDEEFGEEI